MAAPTPTPLAVINRFYMVGITAVVFVPTIANLSAPTSAEITAGTNLTKQVRAIDGWEMETDDVEANDIADLFEKTISGRSQVKDSSLLIYLSKTGVSDARTLLSPGIRGNILLAPGGLVAASMCDIFPVEVKPHGKMYDDKAPFHARFNFNVFDRPALDVAIPT